VTRAGNKPKPLCFVAMPFGTKPDGAGGSVDFDAVYREVIAPAVTAAGLEPLRADEEMGGGIIHKPMFERLILCDYAVADLTTANANVFYELGVRHAVRPYTTVLLFAEGGRLAFDVAPLRAVPYRLDSSGRPASADPVRQALTERLIEASEHSTDSPVFQLVEGLPTPEIDHAKTDVFRDRVRYSAEVKERLAAARDRDADAVRAVENDLGRLEDVEAGVLVDLLLSYRAVGSWSDMIRLVDEMTPPLAGTVLVQEQLGLALNRAGESERAERVLRTLLERQGPSSETLGILGRVYKDRWQAAVERGDVAMAQGALKQAIDTYLAGFEADWRDAYPGINALTLMEIRDPPDPRRERLLPVVEYAVERRLAAGQPDYWDLATRLELAVLAKDEDAARDALADSLVRVRERWEPETTADNLALIRTARAARGETVAWADAAEEALRQQAGR
jgi:tetratricopeptide (TPR) repeat protein